MQIVLLHMQRKRHDAIINKPPNYHQHCYIWPFPRVGQKIKNSFVSDLFFFLSIYSSFHTNDVFILEGFQSNQITMASPLIRHNRTLAEGERQKKTGEHILQYLLKKKKSAFALSHYAFSQHNVPDYIQKVIPKKQGTKQSSVAYTSITILRAT